MKKLLLLGSLAILSLPGFASAAYNDVSLTSSTTLSVNSITVNVSGSAASIESLVVNSTNFVVTILAGSSFQVTAPNLNKLVADVGLGRNVDTCTGSASVLGYNLTGTSDTVVVTVTPSSTLCADTAAASSSTRTDGSGGGGGTVAVAPVTTTTETQQINSLLAQIATLQAQIAALSGATATVAPGTVRTSITVNLSSGSRGASVKTLQQFLNTHGFVIASSGPGSSGNETETFGSLTRTAVQKFQVEHGIAKPGETGYGRVGPKTRAKINELSAQ
ncbi:MAG: peptidoglycan-binding domain-containing protein [bacterium]|nr:peptidoglycan-binding domain-containing protein [bacterium]